MMVRVITLPFDAAVGGFDDTPLRDFLKDKDVHAVREHFFVRHDTPYLVLLVTYTLPRPAAAPAAGTRQGAGEPSWRELVTAEEMPRFNTLRDWRAERGTREGVPPYVICTNRQLASLVKARPQSLAHLASIDGIGKAGSNGADAPVVLHPQDVFSPHSRRIEAN